MFAPLGKKYRKLRDKKYFFALVLGILVLVVGLGSSVIAREHLENSLHADWGPDLFLDYLPVLGMKDVLVWGIEVLIAVFVLALLFHPGYAPFALKSVGLLYLIRSFFIILTPLGSRPDQYAEMSRGFFYDMAYFSNDFFFSGHAAFPFMLALIFWNVIPARWFFLFASAFLGASVLFAHTHYSIDVFAVPFIVPTIYFMCRRFFYHDLSFISGTSMKKE